jgi:hypothetical protein
MLGPFLELGLAMNVWNWPPLVDTPAGSIDAGF